MSATTNCLEKIPINSMVMILRVKRNKKQKFHTLKNDQDMRVIIEDEPFGNEMESIWFPLETKTY